jgi:SnoaL-like protein
MTDTTVFAATALETAEQYVEFWNAAAADEQQRLAAATFTDGVSYHAPLAVMRGPEELMRFRNEFAEHLPDYSFRLRREPETHHDRVRLAWELVTGTGTFATGTDLLELDELGHITSITTFLDQAPEGFDHHAVAGG